MSKLEEQKALPRRKLYRPEEIVRAGRALSGKGNGVLAQIIAGNVKVRKAGIRIEVWGWERMASGEYECRVVDCS